MEMLTASPTTPTSWIAPVAKWSVWQRGDDPDGLPDLSFVEPALRRRLGSLARAFFKVAHECSHDIPSARLVYASRHGDLSKTTAMLIDLSNKQELSPTTFSMSVPNAAAGVFSIFKHDRSPSTTISASESSFGFGLLEACIQLAENPDTPVLFVYADEPASAIYEVASGDVTTLHSIGLLLRKDATSEIFCQLESIKQSPSVISQSQAFLQCLNDDGCASWCGEGKTWNWRKHDRKN
jgi:hypothetical protein